MKLEYFGLILLFPDEDHSIANPQNSMAFISVMERFLAKASQWQIPRRDTSTPPGDHR